MLRAFKKTLTLFWMTKLVKGEVNDEIVETIAHWVVLILQSPVDYDFETLFNIQHEQLLGEIDLLKFNFYIEYTLKCFKVHEHI